MPGPTAAGAVPAGRARTLAQAYRRFGDAIGRCWSRGRLLSWLADS